MLQETHNKLRDALKTEAFEIVSGGVDVYSLTIALAHLQANVYIDVNGAADCVVAHLFCAEKPVGEWPLKGFESHKHAMAYGIGAAKNAIKRLAADLLSQPIEVL